MRRGFVVFACALVACGLNVVGSGGSDEGGGASPTTPANDGATPTEIPIVVEDTPSDAASDGAPAEAGDDASSSSSSSSSSGTTCAADGTTCTDPTACCSKGCNAYSQCGKCATKVGTPCSRTSECCKGLWCGSYSGPAQCQACLKKNSRCDTKAGPSNILCCSGKCTFAYFDRGDAVFECD